MQRKREVTTNVLYAGGFSIGDFCDNGDNGDRRRLLRKQVGE